ncbi:MAG TPA: UDP-N-acetylmuramoyl-tripeptide--D-alanyl-D-alanine ligase [Candidatus Paceibacterota bacterium]|nr:UDP-N-acetylmuramoyl-tripeptide--D-alanyl-D-alanine ligase [Candidatus Paceibacterota bacterium]
MYERMRGFLIRLLTSEAKLALRLHDPQIVAVTGNLGKTTTKDAIYAAVAPHMWARKSEKSFNSDIGVPLAILGLSNPWANPVRWAWALVKGFFSALLPFPKLLVLEVGADAPGDIQKIATWLRPHIAVYTGVPEIPVHIAYFASRDDLVREKRALLFHVRPGGTIIVNADMHPEEATAGLIGTIRTYGFAATADFAATDVRVLAGADGLPAGISVRVQSDTQEATLDIHGAIGKPRAYAALAALAVASALGIKHADAIATLAQWSPPSGRMRLLRGVHGAIIIDDSYNSSPAAALSALETLAEVPGKRKIAILGDMRELGEFSEKGHRLVGQYAAKVADVLVTVGEESKVLAQAARDAGMSPTVIREYGYDSAQQVGKDVAREVLPGDVILVKGSQNRIRLERAVYELLADRSHAQAQLVRHERAWRAKA